MTDSSHIAVLRGGHVESRHRVHAAVVSADGLLLCGTGDPALLTFARSAVKPVQALPLVEDGVADAIGLTAEELALCCASHSGEPMHVALAAAILARIGAVEADLACGAHEPFDRLATQALRASGEEPGRLHNNCSGKHAGMMALARHNGWPLQGYHELQHPVQQRMVSVISSWSGVPVAELATGVDGCGVVTFGMPLRALAVTFARLARARHTFHGSARNTAQEAAAERTPQVAAARVIDAMLRHPDIVAGTKRLCTSLMEVSRSRIFAKVGAEGVYCAGVPAAGVGVAIKVEDGAQRAAEPALLAVLHQLGHIDGHDMAKLERWASPQVKNTRGEVVGALRAEIVLQQLQ